MPFQYKKILVIGATSGIGKALAEKFVAEGSKIIVVGRRKEALDELVKAHGSDKVSSYQFDITKLDAISGFASSVTKEHPDIDSVFLNSGIQRKIDFAKPETIDLSVVNEEITTNYTSYLHLTVAFLPFLQKQNNETSLIFTTSGLGLVPIMRCSNYCATKAALHHLILCMREQVKSGPGNVKIIELFPPAVQTELHDTKHQPDLQNGGQMGMPLNDFVEEAYAGLAAGHEEVVVQMVNNWYQAFEPARQKAFHDTKERMGKMLAQFEKGSS